MMGALVSGELPDPSLLHGALVPGPAALLA